MPLETPPSIWCVHQLTPKTSCSQEDLRNPSGFETMDGSANSMGAMVLMVAFFEFADINHRHQLLPQCLHPTLATRKKNALDSSFWPCPGALNATPAAADDDLPVAQPLWTPTECILHASRILLGESKMVTWRARLVEHLAILSLHIATHLTVVGLSLSIP